MMALKVFVGPIILRSCCVLNQVYPTKALKVHDGPINEGYGRVQSSLPQMLAHHRCTCMHLDSAAH